MNVAVNGDRGCCLSQELGSGCHLFAVANGFGRIGGESAGVLALRLLLREFQRRAHGSRFARTLRQPRALIAALSGAFARVNDELHARSGSHEDYVTVGVSMTAALLVGERAYLAHTGSTAAYLSRAGTLVELTKNDAFEDEGGVPVLMRALGTSYSVDMTVSAFSLTDRDALVLAGRSIGEAPEHVVVTCSAVSEMAQVEAPRNAHTVSSILTGILAMLLFYALLAVR